MRYTILFSIFLLILLGGCNKDKFGSTPSLKFKDVSSTVVHSGQLLVFTLSFNDAEGDLTDTVFVEEIVPNCPASNFSFSDAKFPLPAFPSSKNQKGDLTITFEYNVGTGYTNVAPKCSMNDTAVFRFALKDKAQHISDTVSSPPIILVYQ